MDSIIPSSSTSLGRKTTALEQTILQINSAEQKLETLIQEEKQAQNYINQQNQNQAVNEIMAFY